MYRLAILLQNGKYISKNLDNKDLCDTYILKIMDKQNIKKYIIVNKNNISERWVETF